MDRARIERELLGRVDVWRLFRHVDRKDEYRMATMVSTVKVSGRWVWRRQRLDWLDGVN